MSDLTPTEMRRLGNNTEGVNLKYVGRVRRALYDASDALDAAEKERDEARAQAWNEHNACGVCPYRRALQARVAALEKALTQIAAYRGSVPKPSEMRKIAREALAGSVSPPVTPLPARDRHHEDDGA